MTVQAQDSVQYYSGPIKSGTIISVTEFTFIDNSHISLKLRGIDELWNYGTDYLVDGAGTLERTVTLMRDVDEGQTLAVYLDVPITQNISPEEGGNFPASTNEFVLDKLTYICQMLYERIARSMQIPIDTPFDGTLSEVIPGKAVKINKTGDGLELSDLDPDQAVIEIQKYIETAEQAAESATQAGAKAKEIVDSFTTTEEQLEAIATEAIEKAEEAIEAVDNAEKHKLNSKEIATVLTSSIPQTNTDLHKADGSIITEEDPCWSEFHKLFMKKKRALTDEITTYYKYNSYNYSRTWYSTVASVEDKFYSLTNIINAPTGTWGLFNRHGDFVPRNSIYVKSYYKYELLNSVGHDAPAYLLWQVFGGDDQLAEPGNEHCNEFYAYKDDERLGDHLDNVTNVVVLPPDISSEFRRIQITVTQDDNTYYYYYKATPVEIHAYMWGTVDELNLSAVAGVQTEATVIKPYLITSHTDTLNKRTNKDFLTTEEWLDAQTKQEDYREFYSTDSSLDKTFELENLHDEVEVVGGYLTNRAGVFSGFSNTNYLELVREYPKTKNFDGTITQDEVKSLEMLFKIHIEAVPENNTNGSVIIGPKVAGQSSLLFKVGQTDTQYGGGNHIAFAFESTASTSNHYVNNYVSSKQAIEFDKDYYVKVKYSNKQFDTTYKQMLELYLGEDKESLELQEEKEVALGLMKFPTDHLCIGHSAEWQNNCYFQGAIDLTESYIKINDELWWGNKVVPYAKDSKGNYISDYAYDKVPEYIEEIASNVYETNPEGYTVIGNALDVDGWFAQTAINQGCALGTGLNTQFINHRNDNYINIKGRFMTNRNKLSEGKVLVNLAKSLWTYSPFRLASSSKSTFAVWLGSQASNVWSRQKLETAIPLKEATEYFFEFSCDFTKKYKLVEADESHYEEDNEIGKYKYTLKISEWKGLETEDYTYEFLDDFRFGSAALDLYSISACGSDQYVLNEMPFVNMYSIEVNGRHLFLDNIHVIDRPVNATALPRIAANKEEESYIVVANGITEDVVLATPQKQIDDYTENTALPDIVAAKLEAINKIVENASKAIAQLDTIYSGQLSNLTENYNESMRVITNTQCVLIDSYVNGASWYRVYSDGWCEQGGLSTLVVDYKTINLLVPYKTDDYNIFKQDRYANVDNLVYRSIYDVTATSFKFYNDYPYGASWKTEGYIDIENYRPRHISYLGS